MEAQKSMEREIYHERQKMQFCLLHALNNLFQEKESFTRNELDSIAEQLSLYDQDKRPWTPLSLLFRSHHNPWTGNYDVNVLIAAIESRGRNVTWHDRRNGASSLGLDTPEEILTGILLNVPVKRIVPLWKSRHWIALTKIGGFWYNLDSNLKVPEQFSSEADAIRYIDGMISSGAEVFAIRVKEEKKSP